MLVIHRNHLSFETRLMPGSPDHGLSQGMAWALGFHCSAKIQSYCCPLTYPPSPKVTNSSLCVKMA